MRRRSLAWLERRISVTAWSFGRSMAAHPRRPRPDVAGSQDARRRPDLSPVEDLRSSNLVIHRLSKAMFPRAPCSGRARTPCFCQHHVLVAKDRDVHPFAWPGRVPGRVKQNVEPRPGPSFHLPPSGGTDSTQIRPPWTSTMRLTSARPMPVPSDPSGSTGSRDPRDRCGRPRSCSRRSDSTPPRWRAT